MVRYRHFSLRPGTTHSPAAPEVDIKTTGKGYRSTVMAIHQRLYAEVAKHLPAAR